MDANLGVQGAGAEGLFEESNADAFGPTHLAKRRGGPGLVLEHFGEQSESNRDDLVGVGKPVDGSMEERRLGGVEAAEVLGEGAVGPAKLGKDFACMHRVRTGRRGPRCDSGRDRFQAPS